MKEKDNERRRWVYCDIIHDAIERITDKYGTEIIVMSVLDLGVNVCTVI